MQICGNAELQSCVKSVSAKKVDGLAAGRDLAVRRGEHVLRRDHRPAARVPPRPVAVDGDHERVLLRGVHRGASDDARAVAGTRSLLFRAGIIMVAAGGTRRRSLFRASIIMAAGGTRRHSLFRAGILMAAGGTRRSLFRAGTVMTAGGRGPLLRAVILVVAGNLSPSLGANILVAGCDHFSFRLGGIVFVFADVQASLRAITNASEEAIF